MEFSTKFDTVKLGLSIVYIEGSQVIKKNVFLSLKINLVVANNADPDEMPAAFSGISSGSSLFAKKNPHI